MCKWREKFRFAIKYGFIKMCAEICCRWISYYYPISYHGRNWLHAWGAAVATDALGQKKGTCREHAIKFAKQIIEWYLNSSDKINMRCVFAFVFCSPPSPMRVDTLLHLHVADVTESPLWRDKDRICEKMGISVESPAALRCYNRIVCECIKWKAASAKRCALKRYVFTCEMLNAQCIAYTSQQTG